VGKKMNGPFTRENVHAWQQRRPFLPFVLRLTGGSEYVIRHPEMVMPTRDTVIVGIPEDGRTDEAVARQISMLSMLHIVKIVPYREQEKQSV
jgi:hypothetical protein